MNLYSADTSIKSGRRQQNQAIFYEKPALSGRFTCFQKVFLWHYGIAICFKERAFQVFSNSTWNGQLQKFCNKSHVKYNQVNVGEDTRSQ